MAEEKKAEAKLLLEHTGNDLPQMQAWTFVYFKKCLFKTYHGQYFKYARNLRRMWPAFSPGTWVLVWNGLCELCINDSIFSGIFYSLVVNHWLFIG